MPSSFRWIIGVGQAEQEIGTDARQVVHRWNLHFFFIKLYFRMYKWIQCYEKSWDIQII